MTALKAQSLGSYRLLRKLGTGGMAEVFLAAQRMSGGLTRPVVIKAILPHLAEDEKFNQMFMREARVAAMLTHPNIVQIHDVTTLDDRPCIVMEFLKGRDLWTVLHALPSAKKTVSPQAAAAIIAQAASALDYAHRLRDRSGQPVDLVHRDISPHNLFLTREGHLKVLDFGIAKSAYQQHRTESGVIKGKLPYMAPEQARGKDVDGRADQFSLGVVLWELLTGRRLFARDDALQTMTAMFHDPTPKPSEITPIPEPLEKIVMRVLRRSPTDRFDSCESLAHALRTWLSSENAAPESRLVRRLLADAVPVQADADFYAPDQPMDPDVPSDELRVVGIDFTPSGQESDGKPFASPPQSEMTPTPSMTRKKREARKMQVLLIGGGITLLLVAFGITAWALSDEDPPPLPPTASSAAETPDEVTIAFIAVPRGVTVEVDGRELGSDFLYRAAPGDEVHHVRALIEGREVWRYDAIFREDARVTVPPLALPAGMAPTMVEETAEAEPEAEEPEPESIDFDEIVEDPDAVQAMRPRMRRRPNRMFVTIMRTPSMTTRMTPPRMTPRMTTRMSSMLGMQLDLGYP